MKKEDDTIIGKAKSWRKKDWILHGLTTLAASMIFVLINHFRQNIAAPQELFFQFLIFFMVFGGLQVLFGGIFSIKHGKQKKPPSS